MYYWKVYILKWFYRQNLEVAFIDKKQCKKVPQVDFIYNKIYIPTCGTKEKFNVYTIKSFLTLEDIIEQNKLEINLIFRISVVIPNISKMGTKW